MEALQLQVSSRYCGPSLPALSPRNGTGPRPGPSVGLHGILYQAHLLPKAERPRGKSPVRHRIPPPPHPFLPLGACSPELVPQAAGGHRSASLGLGVSPCFGERGRGTGNIRGRGFKKRLDGDASFAPRPQRLKRNSLLRKGGATGRACASSPSKHGGRKQVPTESDRGGGGRERDSSVCLFQVDHPLLPPTPCTSGSAFRQRRAQGPSHPPLCC